MPRKPRPTPVIPLGRETPSNQAAALKRLKAKGLVKKEQPEPNEEGSMVAVFGNLDPIEKERELNAEASGPTA